MKKALLFAAMFITGCASLTPEQAAYYRNAGDALTGMSNQMQQPAPVNYPSPATTQQRCTYSTIGNTVYQHCQ